MAGVEEALDRRKKKHCRVARVRRRGLDSIPTLALPPRALLLLACCMSSAAAGWLGARGSVGPPAPRGAYHPTAIVLDLASESLSGVCCRVVVRWAKAFTGTFAGGDGGGAHGALFIPLGTSLQGTYLVQQVSG